MLLQKRFVRLQIAVLAFVCIQVESTLYSIAINEEHNPPLRLPNTTLPIKYHLHITTHIHREILAYTGNVTIDLAVHQATKEIVLHGELFEDIVVNLLDLKNNQLFESLKYTTENVTDFLRISSPIELEMDQQYRLEILFVGGIRLQHFGFYRTTYLDELNNTIPLASTQFEPTSARLGFPCFDEPAFKAKFIISITHGSNYTALSNMPIDGEPIQSSDGEMTTTTFQETPIMSTYLIAFVVSNYEHMSEIVDGIEHRVFFPPKSKNHGKKGLKNSIESVTALGNYLGIKYALPKLDHFPLDKTYGLAMENWGIITYNKRSLISGFEGTDTLKAIKMTLVQNHEIAHQWFGNLVSPKWWSYAWLNEGFATYFGYITTELVHPEWKINEIFIEKEVDMITHWPINHSITQYVEKEADIKSNFDAVCYQKSASVIKMFHHAIGLKPFIKGVALFLNKFKYSVADEEDLFGALQTIIDEEDENIFKNSDGISSVMHTWTLNKGIPMVTVIRNYDNDTITFLQRSNTKNVNEKWWIPLSFATASNPNFDQTKADFILPPHGELTIHLKDINLNISNNEWLIVNKQQTGFFFVSYDDRNFGLIADALSSDYEKIHMLNRALLFRDLAEFVDKDIDDMKMVLLALQYLENEKDLMPWSTACDLILELVSKLYGSTTLEMFKGFIRGIVGDIFHRVHRLPSETGSNSKTAAKILEVACKVDLPECLDYTKTLAKEFFFNGQEINGEVRDTALCQGIKYSSAEEFQQLLAKMVAANVSSDEYDDIVYTIRCIESPENIKFFLNFLVGENSTFDAMSDFEKMQYVSFLYNTNYFSRPVIMRFMLENYKTLFKTENVVEYSLSRISNYVSEDDGQKDEFLLLLANIKEYFTNPVQIWDLKIGSRIKQDEHFKRKHERSIYEWISERERKAKSNASPEIRPSLIAARYIVAAGFLSNLISFV